MRRAEAPRSSGCVAIVALATALAYANSLSGAFVFDDLPWIVDNDALARLWPPWAAAAGTLRPLLFWTLALNHAISGLEPWSYHVVNGIVHAAAAILLFLLVRDGLQAPRLAWAPEQARAVALAVSLLWAVHPLNTQAVTYVIQRGESLAGMWCLAAAWALLRAAAQPQRHRWPAMVVGCWWLALATKESAAVLPAVLAAIDILVLTGSPARTWRDRRGLWLALLGPVTVGLVGILATQPGRLAAFLTGDADGGSRWQYGLTQIRVVVEYLRLTFWPRPLRIDHGWPFLTGWDRLLPAVPLMMALLSATMWLAWSRRAVAMIGAWFFLWLAPTSTLVPLRDVLVEHRMYLPLAAVLLAAVVVARRGLAAAPQATGPVLLTAAALILGGLTARRNADYASELSLFADPAAPPTGDRRFYNLQLELVVGDGGVLDDVLLCFGGTGHDEGLREAASAVSAGDPRAALARLASAPSTRAARNLRALCLWQLGNEADALRIWRDEVETDGDAVARVNLAVGLLAGGDPAGALAQLQAAVRARPDLAEAQYNLGTVLVRAGHPEPALAALQAALDRRPLLDVAANNAGAVLSALGRGEEARRWFAEAAARGHITASLNLGLELTRRRDYRQALPHFERVLAADSTRVRALNGRALARYFTGDLRRALADLAAALERAPQRADLRNNIGCVRFADGDLHRAEADLRAALTLDPEQTAAMHNLGKLLAVTGRPGPAAAILRQALALRPGDPMLRANLQRAEALAR